MTDIVERLRSTPNWQRQEYGLWKDVLSIYDRAPFEAADEIERLRELLKSAEHSALGPQLFENDVSFIDRAIAEKAALRQLLKSAEAERDALKAALSAEDMDAYVVLMANRDALAAENQDLRSIIKGLEKDNTRYSKVAAFDTNLIADLQKELRQYKDDTQYCDKHKPNGGVRAVCQTCAMEEMSAALSRIDYLCGEPNEMELSGYDTHYNEDLVVENVEKVIADRFQLWKLIVEWDLKIKKLEKELKQLKFKYTAPEWSS